MIISNNFWQWLRTHKINLLFVTLAWNMHQFAVDDCFLLEEYPSVLKLRETGLPLFYNPHTEEFKQVEKELLCNPSSLNNELVPIPTTHNNFSFEKDHTYGKNKQQCTNLHNPNDQPVQDPASRDQSLTISVVNLPLADGNQIRVSP